VESIRELPDLIRRGHACIPDSKQQIALEQKGLIVITNTHSRDLNSYIVPRPSVRLKLADLADALPVWTSMVNVNDRGAILGSGGRTQFNVDDIFLLEHIGGDFS
jgi:hypothetical protein